MQASTPRWTPPGGVLGRILIQTTERVATLRARHSELEERARRAEAPPPLGQALRRPTVAVLAEIKRRSPSRGDINLALTPAIRAAAYERGGAAALSVLTEPASFGGAPEDIASARSASTLPVLRKDFHLDPLQLIEARAIGASAVLLIVRALDPAALAEMFAAAAELGLESLVEVRSEGELDLALEVGARLVGVNNRDLETLEVDPATVARILPLVPPDCVAVAESGVAGVEDVMRAAAAGADAVLVGSSLSAAGDPAAAVASLAAVPRQPRAVA